ncbi:hypothetical protein [Amycolatopsis albispora]|uniref:hypothetical protein n=1 Tax=Amycolatopsis albispora TaxID=1804986 RepID=UPI0013B454CD|nr:hypothetical protein [Amycolatopsis albispora]
MPNGSPFTAPTCRGCRWLFGNAAISTGSKPSRLAAFPVAGALVTGRLCARGHPVDG